MLDSGTDEFSGRLKRIEKAHRKGYGFEARGTLGRSASYERKRSFGAVLRAVAIMAAVIWVMKGVIYFQVGEGLYQQRLAGLAMGNDFDPIAAALMSADPVTRLIAAFLGEVFP